MGWYADGKQRRKIIGSKSTAEKFTRKTEGELAPGLYVNDSKRAGEEFRKAFDTKILAAMEPNTRSTSETALTHFERIVSPGRLRNLTSDRIADYAAARRLEKRSKNSKSALSTAKFNRELRTIPAALNIGHEWGWLPKRPKVRMLREAVKLPTYVDGETFAKQYCAYADGHCSISPMSRRSTGGEVCWTWLT